MSRIERGIAALLLATAVAGGALIPRLLSQSSGPLGAAVEVAVAPGPDRIVVQAPTVPTPPRPAVRTRSEPSPAQLAPARLVPVAATRPVAKPSVAPVRKAPSPPPTTAPLTPPPTPATTPLATTPATNPTSTKPGNGYGDKNHVHTGPPGHAPAPPQAVPDLRGSGHGRPVQQATTHAVGAHHRGVGHLAPPPPAAAATAHAPGAKTRPQARGASGHGGSPPPVAPAPSGPPPAAHGHSHTH
jgi:hypothetical protein